MDYGLSKDFMDFMGYESGIFEHDYCTSEKAYKFNIILYIDNNIYDHAYCLAKR